MDMTAQLSSADIAKRAAAREAVALVEDGMRLGLGTGSTAEWFVTLLAERVKAEKLNVVGVPTSVRTGELAERLGLKLTTLDEAGWLDLTVDGADEFDRELNLIKGGGGALLQEKIVATASDRVVILTDPSKQVEHLGVYPLPVEVIPFGWETTKAIIEETLETLDVDGRTAVLRMNGDARYVTDGGHFILDLHLKRIGDVEEVADALNRIAGVVDTGLFIAIADEVIVGHEDGTADIIVFHDDDEDH
jgi:ribose 5-phosphate isomerase A